MIPDDLPELKSRLLAAADEHGLGEYRDAILDAAEPSVILERHNGEAAVGETRIGGLPELPPGAAWPEHQGRKLPFIAQLDLASLPRWSGSPLPAEGWLWFFNQQIDGILGHAAVLYHGGPRDALSGAEWPGDGAVHADWDGDGDSLYDAVAVRPTVSLCLPGGEGWWRGYAAGHEMPVAEWRSREFQNEWNRAIHLAHDFNRSDHYDGRQPAGQVLGLPSDSGQSAYALKSHAAEGDDWINLLEVQSAGSMMWSDLGTLNFLARRVNLAAGDAGRVIPLVCSG